MAEPDVIELEDGGVVVRRRDKRVRFRFGFSADGHQVQVDKVRPDGSSAYLVHAMTDADPARAAVQAETERCKAAVDQKCASIHLTDRTRLSILAAIDAPPAEQPKGYEDGARAMRLFALRELAKYPGRSIDDIAHNIEVAHWADIVLTEPPR